MFEFGFTAKDVRRIVWTFIMAAGAFLVGAGAEWVDGGELNWKAWALGALAAGYSAVKNFVFGDDSPLK